MVSYPTEKEKESFVNFDFKRLVCNFSTDQPFFLFLCRRFLLSHLISFARSRRDEKGLFGPFVISLYVPILYSIMYRSQPRNFYKNSLITARLSCRPISSPSSRRESHGCPVSGRMIKHYHKQARTQDFSQGGG